MSQSILISGQGKTGTTGVYNAVKDALTAAGARFNPHFEPTRPEPLLALGRYDPQVPVLTKVMSQRLDDVRVRYADFDRRVMTVRDPRDVVISRLLFFPLIRRTVQRADEAAVDRFLEALRAKEADPASRSVVELHELAGELGLTQASWQGLVEGLDQTTKQIDRHDFHVVAYEDFVEDRLDDLGAYLGMTVSNPAAAGSAWLDHIPRSMSRGEWRNWFTEHDADFFGELFEDYMRRHGYDPGERPSDEPKIDPATASEYVERKLASRREQVASRYARDWEPGQRLDPPELALLVDMASDGDAVASYRAAWALADGAADREEGMPPGLELARSAARRGHVDAMRLTARLLRAGAAATAREDEMEARFWEREADLGGVTVPAPGGSQAPTRAQVRRLRRRLKRVRAERDALAASTRYRVGSLLADLARGPFRRRRRAAAQLLRLAASALRSRR